MFTSYTFAKNAYKDQGSVVLTMKEHSTVSLKTE